MTFGKKMNEPRLPPMPKVRTLIATGAYVSFATLSIIAFHQNQFTLFVLLGTGLIITASIYYRRKCPSCGTKLKFKKEYFPLPDSHKFRCLFSCSGCGSIWDRGDIGDDASS